MINEGHFIMLYFFKKTKPDISCKSRRFTRNIWRRFLEVINNMKCQTLLFALESNENKRPMGHGLFT